MIGKSRKGQGALEYLIIIAGVLAIAAIVVYFLSGATNPRQTAFSACRNAAAQCRQAKFSDPTYDCYPDCVKACADPTTGQDLLDGTQLAGVSVDDLRDCDTSGYTSAYCACVNGDLSYISSSNVQ